MAALAAAGPAVLTGHRISSPPLRSSLVVLPPLPRRTLFTSSASCFSNFSCMEHRDPARIFNNFGDPCRFSSLRSRASSEETSGSVQTDELLSDLKEKWDAIENKSTVYLYGGGAIIALWLSTIVVGAINSVPLLPKIMELVGLGYTGWFVYRYLLFKSSRKELASDIEDLKKKIAGAGE